MVFTSAGYLELSTNPIGADGRVPIGTDRSRLDQWNPYFVECELYLFCSVHQIGVSSPCPSRGTKITDHVCFLCVSETLLDFSVKRLLVF